MRDKLSPVQNMYIQPEPSIHTYGALPTAVLSKTYSGVYQLKSEPTKARERHSGHDASVPTKGVRQYYPVKMV